MQEFLQSKRSEQARAALMRGDLKEFAQLLAQREPPPFYLMRGSVQHGGWANHEKVPA